MKTEAERLKLLAWEITERNQRATALFIGFNYAVIICVFTPALTDLRDFFKEAVPALTSLRFITYS